MGELNWFEKNEKFGLLDKDFRVHLKETSENQIFFISFILYFFNGFIVHHKVGQEYNSFIGLAIHRKHNCCNIFNAYKSSC